MAGNLKLTGKTGEVAQKMLLKVCKILDKNGISYNLEGGTLLGIVRENRLLPWDNDVDLTITEEFLDKLTKIRWKFWLAGYRTRIRKTKNDMPYFPKGSVRLFKIQTRFLFFKKYDLLDIFVKRRSDEKYFWLVGVTPPILKSAPSHFYDDLTTISFMNFKYSVPREYKDYLAFRYGDWQTPVKSYNYKKDDLAIVND